METLLLRDHMLDQGTVRVIEFNRPARRNAISLTMMHELRQAIEEAAADPAIRVLILTGQEAQFSAGADLSEVPKTLSTDAPDHPLRLIRAITSAMETCPKPVIAAIEGYCVTGGMELALACDLRIAGEGAKFGITSAKLGTLPGFGGTQRLPRLIGESRALELLMTADLIDTAEAYRIGLVNRAVAKAGALSAALDLAATLSRRAPLSLKTMKQAVSQGAELGLEAALELEFRLGMTLMETEDRTEGLKAFAEKREPRFIGK